MKPLAYKKLLYKGYYEEAPRHKAGVFTPGRHKSGEHWSGSEDGRSTTRPTGPLTYKTQDLGNVRQRQHKSGATSGVF